MATKHTSIKLYSEKDISPQKIYSIKLGKVYSVNNDYNNGIYFNLDNATDLYNFFLDHPDENFLINNCDAAEIRITHTYNEDNKLYSDIDMTQEIPVINFNLYIWKNNAKTVYAKGYFVDLLPPIYYTSGGTPKTTGSELVAPFFVWDDRDDINFSKNNYVCNNLCMIGKPYRYEVLTANKKYIHYISEKGKKFNGGKQETVINPNPLIVEVIPGFMFSYYATYAAYFPYTVWRYIFIYYSELTDISDHDDSEKQEPSQWEYPNGPGGPSKPGGGDGDQEDTSDPIIEDDIIEGLSSDFVKLYKITKANLTALSEYMLQDDFLTNIKKLYADPMDAIISLNTFPINATGTAGVITTSGVSTGINAVQINNSIIDIDCGKISMKEYWGSFLDYETKISLFLPYVGIQPISTDDFMNDIIHVVYRVDLLSGGFVVFVKNSKGIVHQTTGNMAYHMPVTSIDYSRMYASLITGAVGLSGAAVTGGASIAAAKTAKAAFAAKEALAGSAITTGANTMQNFHPQIQMSGNFGGNTGICSNKKPYLIIERPVPNVPDNYSAIKGNTSNVTVKLGDCSGFTQISDMQIKYISATDAEKTQILNLLTSGVYF